MNLTAKYQWRHTTY